MISGILFYKRDFRFTGDLNNLVEKYAKNQPNDVEEIVLYFPKTKEERTYIGNSGMWLAGIEEYQVPNIIGDIIFIVSNNIIHMIEVWHVDYELCKSYLEFVKQTILLKSNNILLLRIIENIGLHFVHEYPGYALELASNVKILFYDTARYIKYFSLRTVQVMEQQIMYSFGVSHIEKRYALDSRCSENLQQYVGNIQIYYTEQKQACYDMLDYMYSKINKGDGKVLLQIQKMDMRRANVTRVREGYLVTPIISGAAKDLVIEDSKNRQPCEDLLNELVECGRLFRTENLQPNKFLKICASIFSLSDDIVEKEELVATVIDIIDGILSKKNECVDSRFRTELCAILLEQWEGIFIDKFPISDYGNIRVLFSQICNGIDKDIEDRILTVLFKILVYEDGNHLVHRIRDVASEYLSSNVSVARIMFKAILMYAQGFREDDIIKYVCDRDINFEGFDLGLCKTENLYTVVFCGLHLSDGLFETTLRYIVDVLRNVYEKDSNYERFIHWAFNISAFLRREIVDGDDECFNKVLGILFYNVGVDIFTDRVIDFYNSVFHIFLPEFFDTYNDREARERCKKRLLLVEEKVKQIPNIDVQEKLAKSLILATNNDGDWSKFKTEFSYADKMFLQEQFRKYSTIYPMEMMYVIYQLQIKELLPEILVPISYCWWWLRENNENKLRKILHDKNGEIIIHILITQALKNSDKIRIDYEYTDAYEKILEILIDYDDEYAAVVLNEFRSL